MRNIDILKSIINKVKLLLFLTLFGAFTIQAQTTEHYSDEIDNATSFSHSGLSFSINGSYLHIENYTGYGWTGSVADNHYVDNSGNLMGSSGVIGSFTNSGSDFYVHDLYILPSANGITQTNAGTVIIRGKLNSSTEFTHTVQSGDINLSSANNFYTYVDLSSYSSYSIDELEFETTGSILYIAIDAFKHSAAATVPTVTTTAASSISTTSATLGGNVTSDGGADVTERGVVYSKTDATPTIAEGATKDANGLGTGIFSESIGSLDVNTTYYYNAYAINSEGTSYGTAGSFTTLPLAATVTTQAVTDKTMTTATGNGNITSLGDPNPTQHGVCWNTGGTPTTANSKTTDGAVSATGAFTSSITGLNPNTTYYVKAYVTNTGGTTYGNEVSFTTEPEAPTVTTQDVIGITMTTAIGNGNITDIGSPPPTQHGVCWNTEGAPTITDSKTEEGATPATGVFMSSITSLSPNTTYYVRAYATNTAGTSYGNQVSFTTDPKPATVTTQAVTDIEMTTATGNGNVTDLGDPNPTQHGVCWNTGGTPTTADSKTTDGAVSATGVFTSSITGLNPNTIYYVKAYVTNTAGTTYGSQVFFNTAPEPPTVTTQDVTSITQTTATGNGNITDLGAPNPTQHGVCWNTGGNPTTADTKTEEGAVAATGTFTSSMTSLSPYTTYYVRAYATNTAGTSYGEEISFKTLPDVPIAETNAASDVDQTTAILNGKVYANDLSVAVTFEYGLTDSYGSTITADQSPVTGLIFTDVSANITGLSPNTEYHFRVVGQYSKVSIYGDDQTFTTSKYDQVITFAELTDKTTNDPDFDAGATSDLGLDVAYTSSNEQVATIVSGLIHIVGAGTTDITASQEGNDTVNVATPVVQSLTVTQATGLENKEFPNLKMYPNPVKDYLSIDVGDSNVSNVEISIIDLSGKIVYCKKSNNTVNTIDVSSYNSGLYFVEVKTSRGIQKLKLLIE